MPKPSSKRITRSSKALSQNEIQEEVKVEEDEEIKISPSEGLKGTDI